MPIRRLLSELKVDNECISKFKTISTTSEQINEIFKISHVTSGLSQYDIINYIIARDNNAILATGDRKLKDFSESNGVEVIRTLKIIRLMYENDIISNQDVVNACIRLKTNKSTRIPINNIDDMINEFEKDTVTCWVLYL